MKMNSALHVVLGLRARHRVPHADALELALAVNGHDLGVVKDLDAVVLLDLVHEIARHRLAEIGAADHEPAWRACSDRNIAAWPAELPPPTTSTGSSAHSCASARVAA